MYATAFQSGLKLFNSSGISVGDNNLVISDNTQPLLSASLWARVNPSEPENSKVAMIAGATVGAILLLLLIIGIVVAIAVIYRYRSRNGYGKIIQ